MAATFRPWSQAERNAAGSAYRHAASLARNCAHSCVSEKHCDFLHAAHERLAEELEEFARRVESGDA